MFLYGHSHKVIEFDLFDGLCLLVHHLHAADQVLQDAKQLQEGGVAWQRHLEPHGAAGLKAISAIDSFPRHLEPEGWPRPNLSLSSRRNVIPYGSTVFATSCEQMRPFSKPTSTVPTQTRS